MTYRELLAAELVSLRRITARLGETIPITEEPEQVRILAQELRKVADTIYYLSIDWRNSDIPNE